MHGHCGPARGISQSRAITAAGPVRPRENSRGHENRRFPRASTSGDGGSAGRHDHGGRAKKYRRAARSKTGRAAGKIGRASCRERRVSVRVDLGGRRSSKNKKNVDEETDKNNKRT